VTQEVDAARAVELAVVKSPFAVTLGVQHERVEADRVVVRLPFSENNVTVGDMVHGGAIASLIDVAATGAAWSGLDDPAGYRGTTIGLSVSYLAAARSTGLVADARVRRRGRSVCFIDVSVRDDSEQEVASAQVTYKLSGPPKQKQPAEVFAELFGGKSVEEQQSLLATLERGGAALYEQMAAAADTEVDRQRLLEAARREIANAELLESAAKPK
jgi:uncharacterized protein (TIGR00369 family)